MPKVTTDAMDELWQDFSKGVIEMDEGVIDMEWDTAEGVFTVVGEQDEPRGYELIDCVMLEKRWPGSFSTPSPVEIARIKPNDFVKLFFRDPLIEGFPERLWIQVGSYDLNYGGVGRVANSPYVIDLMYGDTVQFSRQHILEILKREIFNARGGIQVPAVVPGPEMKFFSQLALPAGRED